MTYHTHKLQLSSKHADQLINGGTIRLKHEHLHGEHEVHLTKTQIAKLNKAYAAGKGTTLRFSDKQRKHTLAMVYSES